MGLQAIKKSNVYRGSIQIHVIAYLLHRGLSHEPILTRACGKTNILEAISLLNQGKGLRKANIENFLYQETIYDNTYKTWGVNVDFVAFIKLYKSCALCSKPNKGKT